MQSDPIQPPMVLDVFALDAITEMLTSPLRFLSYINRRVGYTEQLMATHETVSRMRDSYSSGLSILSRSNA
jgi:hypothetical protein